MQSQSQYQKMRITKLTTPKPKRDDWKRERRKLRRAKTTNTTDWTVT